MKQWFDLWSRSFDIVTGAPVVIDKRLAMFKAAPASFDSMLEANRMVAEKMIAMNESMWSLWRDSMLMRWPPTPTAAARTAAKALKPISSRVRSNRRRLK